MLASLALVLLTLQSQTGAVTGRILSADGSPSSNVRVAAVPVPENGLEEATEVLAGISETDASCVVHKQ